MGLISAGTDAVRGTLADQWVDFFTAPTFDEQTLVAPGVLRTRNSGRGSNTKASTNIVSDGSRIAVPENTAVIITDGDGIAAVSVQPGYFIFYNDGNPSIFTGTGLRNSLIAQSWERFKFGGQPGRQQLIYYVNLREIRNIQFGTPAPLPYRDFSLVSPGSSQAPLLRLKARGQYSIRVADPIRFFQEFLPAKQQWYSLADDGARSQLSAEFLTAFAAALQSLSRTTEIASLTAHGPELASALTSEAGPKGSWLERFGIEVVAVAISALEFDDASRELMDKYNQGTLLGGAVGNAYTQTTMADAALAMGQGAGGDDGVIGVAMGLASIGNALSGMNQPTQTASAGAPNQIDPVATLGQLKAMLEQGLITEEQYAAKQQEVLGRM